MTLQRYLDHIEESSLNNAPAQFVEFRGEVDEQALTRAFEFLCARYPVLRGRIRHDGRGYLLQVASDHRPALEVLAGDEAKLWVEVKRRWDPSRTLVRLLLVRGVAGGLVALQMDHAIVDARSWTTMFRELWELYTKIVLNGDPPVEVTPGNSLPCAPSLLLEHHFGDSFFGGVSTKQAPDAERTSERSHITRADVLQRSARLTPDDTAALVAAARSQNGSFHAVVCGAILVAQRQQAATSGGPALMGCLSPIDFRERVTPPVGATETTNFLGRHLAQVHVAETDDVVSVGMEVKHQLDTALARSDLPPTDAEPLRTNTTLESRLALALVSNIGIMPRFDLPKKITFVDWRRILPLIADDFPAYALYTYEDRLSIIFFGSAEHFTDEEADQILSRVVANLRDATDTDRHEQKKIFGISR